MKRLILNSEIIELNVINTFTIYQWQSVWSVDHDKKVFFFSKEISLIDLKSTFIFVLIRQICASLKLQRFWVWRWYPAAGWCCLSVLQCFLFQLPLIVSADPHTPSLSLPALLSNSTIFRSSFTFLPRPFSLVSEFISTRVDWCGCSGPKLIIRHQAVWKLMTGTDFNLQ